MEYPENCTTDQQKITYHCRMYGILKILYKAFNYWRYNGITQNQYDKMGTILATMAENQGVTITSQSQGQKIITWIKNKYPFSEQLSDAQYRSFLKKHEDVIFNHKGLEAHLKENLQNDETFEVEIDGD